MIGRDKTTEEAAIDKFFQDFPTHEGRFNELLRRAATTSIPKEPKQVTEKELMIKIRTLKAKIRHSQIRLIKYIEEIEKEHKHFERLKKQLAKYE